MLVIFQILRQATNPCLVRLRGQKRNHRGEWTSPRKAALSVQNQVLVQLYSVSVEKVLKTSIRLSEDSTNIVVSVYKDL